MTEQGVAFEHLWVMPSRYTFTMAPVQELLARYHVAAPDQRWADPFAGLYSPASDRNDINPEANSPSHEGALEWLRHQPSEGYDGILLDPPYSYSQATRFYAGGEQWESYKGRSGTFAYMEYMFDIKDEASRIVKPGGHAISFGWDSTGLGNVRGFKLTDGLILCHGQRHDTIITCEVKL